MQGGSNLVLDLTGSYLVQSPVQSRSDSPGSWSLEGYRLVVPETRDRPPIRVDKCGRDRSRLRSRKGANDTVGDASPGLIGGRRA